MILADTPPSANQVWVVLVALASLCGSAGSIWLAVMATRRQKAEVTFGFVPASKKEHDDLAAIVHRESDNAFSKIGGIERALRKEVEAARKDSLEEARKIHERINDVLAAVSRLEGRLEK